MHKNRPIRWGMIGCGHIAETFVKSFRAVSNAELCACAASDVERAKAFATEYNIEHVHQSYSALVDDESIDVVYIATTHNFHFEHIMLCLAHNKHVLCEKPLTVNAMQAKLVQVEANKRNLLVVEAVWTRFLPAITALQTSLKEEVIGTIKTVYANFCLNRVLPDEHRLMNLKLAGGALLDLGIYPITFADIVFNAKPVKATASAIMSHTGIDQVSNYLLEFEGGKTALLSAGFRQSAPVEALIYGDKGHIRVPHFLGAREFQVYRDGQEPSIHKYDYNHDDKFSFEIEHLNTCLRQSRYNSEILPLSKSVEIVELMDNLRSQFNLKYTEDSK
ncbi:Gfo/Idh/MocA family protein [Ningiella sp. W23]|uniref:Gfo/Idh/MocA family protein n=1 Tax=Ningiella sp. W23 TaxID=3023715 RepID=UPI003756A46F